jgi:putative ABC transport system ATP-binding protein
MQLLRQVTLRKERAVLVVTHDQRIFPFADRIIHMDDGRISHIDSPRQKEAA